MPIIDNDYKKYNINKLPRNKYERGNATSVVTIGGSSSTSTQSTINTGNFIGRNLWGQYFDDTQDINGTMYVEGSVNVKEDVNISGTLRVGASGSWDAESQTLTAVNGFFSNAEIETLTGGTANLNEVNANSITSNNINNSGKIVTNELEAQSLTAAQGYIHTLTSDNIWTKDLTVAGSAHFFELVIDKIKSVGGNALLTPADGFELYAWETATSPLGHTLILYFLAADDNNSIKNMWEVGDQALIQNFNQANVGTNYNIHNTYFWSIVKNVSSVPYQYIEDDDHLLNFIEVSLNSGEYDGNASTIVDDLYQGCDVVMLGNRTNTERQTAIYIAAYNPSSGAYDPDLKAPFMIYYEGINDFNLGSHKVQWWSSGSRTTGIPQNKMVGEFYISAGKTIQDYIDENIKDAGINMITLDYGTDIWMINADYNYNIITPVSPLTDYQTWNTTIKIKHNGNDWIFDTSSVDAYLITASATGTVETPLASNEYWHTFDDIIQPGGYFAGTVNIGLNSQALLANHFSNWNDATSRVIRFRFNTVLDEQGTQTTTKDIDIQCIKLIKGQNGSSTTYPVDQYSFVKNNTSFITDIEGNTYFFALYGIKKLYIDSNGHSQTVVDLANIPNTLTARFYDDASIHYMDIPVQIINNQSFKVEVEDYFQNTPYNNYKEALDDLAAPNYIAFELLNGNTIIDRDIIPLEYLGNTVFEVTDNAIIMAVQDSVSGAKLYTDGQINTVTNRISSLEVDVSGIRGRVGTLETEYSDLSGVVQTKASTSELNQTANTINARVTSTTETLQNNINTVDGKFGNYYDKDTTEGLINVAATGVYLGVRRDINGDLSETGIDITNKKITINSENTDFLGNINLYNPNEGLVLYDVSGTARIGIYNNPVTANDNLWETLYDNKTESKNTNTQQIFTHTRIPLGMMANGTLTITKTSMQVLRNYQQIPVAGCQVSYTVYRGTTSVKTGNFTDNQITKQNGYAIINDLFGNTDINTTTANYYITLTVTYTFTEAVAGDLTSIVSLYRGYSSDDTIQMIGTDGVIFRSGYEKQLKVGNTIEAKNYGNLISVEPDGIYRTIPELTTEEHRWQWSKGDISSSYPYREVSQNYTVELNDTIIQCNAQLNITLPADIDFIGKEYLIMDTSGNNPKIYTANSTTAPIHLNGSNSAVSNITMDDRWAMYRCVRFPAAWIITT